MNKKAILCGLFSAFSILGLPLILSLTGEITMTEPLGNLKWILYIIIGIAFSASFTMGYQFYLFYIQKQQTNTVNKKAVLSGLLTGLAYVFFQFFVIERMTPVPESMEYYKWITYSFLFIIHGVIGYYSYSHYAKKQNKLSPINSAK